MKNGFTLVELLVTISIIAVLSTIGFTTLSGVQSKARDSVRKNDLNKLATALAVYFQKNSQYIKDSPDCQTDPDTSTFYTNIKNYMSDQIVPKDPNTNQAYCYMSKDGNSFRLFAKLENCDNTSEGMIYTDKQQCQTAKYNYSWVSDDLIIAAASGDLVAISASTSKPFSCENFGDLDKNGQITQNDSQIISDKLAANTLSNDEKIIADVNYDRSLTLGTVDRSDVSHINSYVNNEIANFNVCTNIKPPPCDGMGDVTTNGKVTPMDFFEVFRIIDRLPKSLYTGLDYTTDQITRANVADPASTGVNLTDVSRIVRYLAGTDQSFQSCPQDPPCFNKRGASGGMGDVDGDGKVSDNDRYLITQSISNPALLSSEQAKRADVDDTVGLTSNDALGIRNYLLGILFQGVTNTFPVCSL